ncbi:SLC13 family permease [Thiohalocapsa marina]|uniref:SLC13 family permease n=1 Tax=Thiohalocapsa marina TaxID=424902 RepID=A0A5M8FPH3_9GAMM|nr:SLC13 family permease [Thiohalocapsa marina]KAA6186707.1 SLC13 family permease [Thiohalocapsa marina]
MSLDLMLVLGLLIAAVAMFSLGRPRADAVGLSMMVALPFTGVIEMREALAGFSNPNIILIAAMFVIGEGLARTGIAKGLGDWLVARGGKSETRLVAMLMLMVGALGSVMYSTGVVAIFIPVALRIAQSTGMSPSQVLMPLSFAALISGMLSLVAAAPNLIVNYELVRTGTEGMHFFTLTPIGLPILLLGVAYMMFARRWLKDDRTAGGASGPAAGKQASLGDWVEAYGLADRELRVRVRPGSPLMGQPLSRIQGQLGLEAGLEPPPQPVVLAIERKRPLRAALIAPDAATEIAAGDILLIDSPTPIAEPAARCQALGLEPLPLSGAYFTDRAQEVGMAEVMVPAESRLLGKTLAELRRLSALDLSVIGLRRGQTAHTPEQLREDRLRPGDTLLLVGPWKAISQLRGDRRDLIALNLPKEFDEVLPAARQAPFALLALAVTVGLMVLDLVPAVQAALIGCLLMGLFRVIDLDSAYRAISLRTLVLIAGMLPFGIALERTGGIDLAATTLVALLGEAGPYVILATLYLVTVLIGLFVVAAANAVLVIPVALALAAELGASPYPFAIMVALAASSAFMTPIAPPNAMVATAGNYRFADYLRIGLPFVLIVMSVSLVLVPWLFPFY